MADRVDGEWGDLGCCCQLAVGLVAVIGGLVGSFDATIPVAVVISFVTRPPVWL